MKAEYSGATITFKRDEPKPPKYRHIVTTSGGKKRVVTEVRK